MLTVEGLLPLTSRHAGWPILCEWPQESTFAAGHDPFSDLAASVSQVPWNQAFLEGTDD